MVVLKKQFSSAKWLVVLLRREFTKLLTTLFLKFLFAVCFYKQSFIGTQSSEFIYMLSGAAFMLQ